VAISTASKSSFPDLRRPAKITARSDSTSCATSCWLASAVFFPALPLPPPREGTQTTNLFVHLHEGAAQSLKFAELGNLPFRLAPGGRARPAECIGCERKVIMGNPDPKHISTSYAERQNLTMRMGMRRFTRLTNAFSKKVENHAYQVALHFMYYNFARIHTTLRVTPAMEAGVSDHVWDLEEIADLAK
jgi:hypothetical protein